MVAKVLQIPSILGITGGTIKVQHPDLTAYTRTSLVSPFTAAGVTLTVADNNDFSDDDWFILGEVNDEKTEACDVNGAVTRGTSLTITNTTKFSHEIHTPVTRIQETQIKIYGAATSGGAGTLVATLSIQWNSSWTEYTLKSTDTAYAYYYATFYDGTTIGSASDYVIAAGLAYNSVEKMVEAALNEARATIDEQMITRDWMLSVVNDWQDEVNGFVTSDGIPKEWSFEVFEDASILLSLNENRYALSGLASVLDTSINGSIINMRMGSWVLRPVDIAYFEEYLQGIVRDALSVQATAGATTITLSNSAQFDGSGTITLGVDTLTYTANNTTTNVISGIPAAGTGAITTTHAIGTTVWQGVSPGKPAFYAISGGYIYLDVPVMSTYVKYPLKFRAIKKLSRLTSFSSTTSITFPYLFKYYGASRIESRKGNTTNSDRLMALHQAKLEMEARKDGVPTVEPNSYYNFDNKNINLVDRESPWWTQIP